MGAKTGDKARGGQPIFGERCGWPKSFGCANAPRANIHRVWSPTLGASWLEFGFCLGFEVWFLFGICPPQADWNLDFVCERDVRVKSKS